MLKCSTRILLRLAQVCLRLTYLLTQNYFHSVLFAISHRCLLETAISKFGRKISWLAAPAESTFQDRIHNYIHAHNYLQYSSMWGIIATLPHGQPFKGNICFDLIVRRIWGELLKRCDNKKKKKANMNFHLVVF